MWTVSHSVAQVLKNKTLYLIVRQWTMCVRCSKLCSYRSSVDNICKQWSRPNFPAQDNFLLFFLYYMQLIRENILQTLQTIDVACLWLKQSWYKYEFFCFQILLHTHLVLYTLISKSNFRVYLKQDKRNQPGAWRCCLTFVYMLLQSARLWRRRDWTDWLPQLHLTAGIAWGTLGQRHVWWGWR